MVVVVVVAVAAAAAICGFGFKMGGVGLDFSLVSLTGDKLALVTVGVVLLEAEGEDLREEEEFLLLRDRLLAVETGRDGSRGIGVLVEGAASSLDPLVGLGEDDADDKDEGDAVMTLVNTLVSGVFFQEGVEVNEDD